MKKDLIMSVLALAAWYDGEGLAPSAVFLILLVIGLAVSAIIFCLFIAKVNRDEKEIHK